MKSGLFEISKIVYSYRSHLSQEINSILKYEWNQWNDIYITHDFKKISLFSHVYLRCLKNAVSV